MYQAPEINVLFFSAEDIVRTSGGSSSYMSFDDNVDMENGWT